MKQRRREDGEPEKIFNSSFQGKLHHLDVGAGGELRLLGKHGPKSAGGLCRQFEVLVHTLGSSEYTQGALPLGPPLKASGRMKRVWGEVNFMNLG